MNKKLKRLNSQQGLVSIVVTLIVVSIMTLIALGFAELANREQRQALDEQLSSQAQYAAEAGVNAVSQNIGSYPTSPTCYSIDTDDLGVKAPCVLVNKDALEELKYDIDDGSSSLINIDPDSNLRELQIGWQDEAFADSFSTDCSHPLPTAGAGGWVNRTGLLRAMLIPRSFGSRPNLVEKTQTTLLYPTTGTTCGVGGDVYLGNTTVEANKGGFVNGNCVAGRTPRCISKITISIPSTERYVLRIKGIYRPSKVYIRGTNDLNTPVRFENAQVSIESTGRANDVVRTIKVTVPIEGFSGNVPEHTIETGESFCKRISLANPSGLASVDDVGPYNTQPSCTITN